MISITITGTDYSVYNDWDIPISKAIELHEVVLAFPETLLDYYRALVPVAGELDDVRNDRIKNAEDKITPEHIYKEFPTHYGYAIAAVSDIPQDIIAQILPGDRTVFFQEFIFKIAFGIYTGIADYKPKGINSFKWNDQEYWLPETRKVMGAEVPMVDEIALVFTEASDLLIQSSEMNSGKWDRAANIVSILCRPKGEAYDERKSLDRVDGFKELPMWIVLEVFFCCIGPLIMSHQSDLLYSLKAKSQEPKAAPELTGDGMPASTKWPQQEHSEK